MREIRLVGGISAVELRDGVLTITCDGEDLAFAIGAQAAADASAPRQRKPREPKETPAPETIPPGNAKPNGVSSSPTGGRPVPTTV